MGTERLCLRSEPRLIVLTDAGRRTRYSARMTIDGGWSGLSRFALAIAVGLCASAGCGDSSSTGGGGAGAASSTGGADATGGAGGMASSGGAPSTGGAPGECPGEGAEITTLSACADQTASPIAAALGCVPAVDGTLHEDEWSDGSCELAGDMTLSVKHDADTLYIAASGQPSCGCPMFFYFDPTMGTSPDGDEFAIGLFDDPFNPDGDRVDQVNSGGAWVNGEAPPGIVTLCPGNQPSPIRYEISIPYSALGLVAGQEGDIGFALVHAGAVWPAGLSVDQGGQPDDLSTFGAITGSW